MSQATMGTPTKAASMDRIGQALRLGWKDEKVCGFENCRNLATPTEKMYARADPFRVGQPAKAFFFGAVAHNRDHDGRLVARN